MDVLHCKCLVWNIVSTNNQPLNAKSVEDLLKEAHTDAQGFELLSAKRAHVKLFCVPTEPPATIEVPWECAGCCEMCGRFGYVAASCPCSKSAWTRCGGAHPTHQCKETKVVCLGEKETVALLCQAYNAMTNLWSPRAQKLIIELSTCGKAKRREAVVDLVSNQFEGTVLPLLHQVKEMQKRRARLRNTSKGRPQGQGKLTSHL